jgi:hypothetical protein
MKPSEQSGRDKPTLDYAAGSKHGGVLRQSAGCLVVAGLIILGMVGIALIGWFYPQSP